MPEDEVPGSVVSVTDKDPVDTEPDPLHITLPPSDVPIVGKVWMKNEMHPEGTIIEVPGLGGIPNGGSKEVDYTMAIMYEQATHKKWPVKDGKAQDLHIQVPPPVEEEDK